MQHEFYLRMNRAKAYGKKIPGILSSCPMSENSIHRKQQLLLLWRDRYRINCSPGKRWLNTPLLRLQ
jgi:hypothetical protein